MDYHALALIELLVVVAIIGVLISLYDIMVTNMPGCAAADHVW